MEDKLRPVESLANGIQYVAGLTANIRGAVERVVSTKNAGTVLAVGLIAGAAFRLYKTYGA